MAYSKSKDNEKKAALENVNAMFSEANNQSIKHIDISNKLVKSALQILMKFRLKLPKEYKNRFCKNCKTYFVYGVNCRVRTRNGKLIYFCFECKRFIRKNITPNKIN